jgi:prevent-host-death family protein
MPKTISATTVRDNFAEIINRVTYTGEEFIIAKQGKPVARITPIKQKETPAEKLTGTQFLKQLTKYGLTGGPKDFAKNHDKYTWE